MSKAEKESPESLAKSLDDGEKQIAKMEYVIQYTEEPHVTHGVLIAEGNRERFADTSRESGRGRELIGTSSEPVGRHGSG